MIEAASIIFTTCTDKHLDAVSRTDFDWVIVEEAGRLVGCDLIIPMRLGTDGSSSATPTRWAHTVR